MKQKISSSAEPDKEKFVQDLMKKNPDVLLAQKIMQQTKLTTRNAMRVDQSNYYRLP